MTGQQQSPFFHDVAPAQRDRGESIDVYTAVEDDRPRPALIFVHGGPIAPETSAREWPGYIGYGSLAVASGLVGVVLDHRLYSDKHYPTAADDLAAAVQHTRALSAVDPDHIGIWFFSGGGPLAVDWMYSAPPWLRCLAWTYPVLAPPPGWDGDVPRFDAISALTAAPSLPKLLVRVGNEYPSLVPNQAAFIKVAEQANATLEVIDIADADHGFEGLDYPEDAPAAVRRAMDWAASNLRSH